VLSEVIFELMNFIALRFEPSSWSSRALGKGLFLGPGFDCFLLLDEIIFEFKYLNFQLFDDNFGGTDCFSNKIREKNNGFWWQENA
jgi:hypothetical protein